MSVYAFGMCFADKEKKINSKQKNNKNCMKLTFICKRTGGILMLILLLPLPLFAKK